MKVEEGGLALRPSPSIHLLHFTSPSLLRLCRQACCYKTRFTRSEKSGIMEEWQGREGRRMKRRSNALVHHQWAIFTSQLIKISHSPIYSIFEMVQKYTHCIRGIFSWQNGGWQLKGQTKSRNALRFKSIPHFDHSHFRSWPGKSEIKEKTRRNRRRWEERIEERKTEKNGKGGEVTRLKQLRWCSLHFTHSLVLTDWIETGGEERLARRMTDISIYDKGRIEIVTYEFRGK